MWRLVNPKQIKGIINNNPELWLNQLVYAILILIMLFFGVVKVRRIKQRRHLMTSSNNKTRSSWRRAGLSRFF